MVLNSVCYRVLSRIKLHLEEIHRRQNSFKNWLLIFFRFLEEWMEQPTCILYGGRSRHTKMCTSVFSFIPQGKENSQLSILIISFHIIFIQNLRENSHKIKQNSNWTESARINLPTAMVEWLFNFELPSLKESETPYLRLFKLFLLLLCQRRFHALFVFDSSLAVVTLFTMT